MKKHLLSLLLVWAPIIAAMNDDDNAIQLQLDDSPSASSSSHGSQTASASTASSTREAYSLDQIDQAVALTLEKDLTDEAILETIDLLKLEEDTLERNAKKLRKERKTPSDLDKVRFIALQGALGSLRVNWAERILKRAQSEDFKKSTQFTVVVQTCIEELQIFISYRARIVNEPYRMRQEREIRAREILEEIDRREATKKQLQIEQTIWKTLIDRIVKHRDKEKALLPAAPTPDPVDEAIRALAHTMQGEQKTSMRCFENTRAGLAEKLLPKKQALFAQISDLLKECKKIDAEFLPVDFIDHADDDDDDNSRQSVAHNELDGYYSSLSTILKAAVEQVPLRQTDCYIENIRDSQAHYLRLLLSEQLAAESTCAALTSLLSVNDECLRNRHMVLRMVELEKDHFLNKYEFLHSELETQKVLLCRLKKLAGEELNMYEKERLKKAEQNGAQ